MSYTVDLSSPIETSHPDNAGMSLALLGIPGMTGGSRWPDATELTSGASLTGNENQIRWVGNRLDLSGGHGTISEYQTNVTRTSLSFAITTSGVRSTDGFRGIFGWFGGLNNCALLYLNGSAFPQLIIGSPASGYFLRVSTVQLSLTAPQRWGCTFNGTTSTLYLNGLPLATGSTSPVTSIGATTSPLRLGRNDFDGSVFNGALSHAMLLERGADAGWFARDYEWSLDTSRDPRLRRLSGTSYFTPMAVAPTAGTFLPGFVGIAPGW